MTTQVRTLLHLPLWVGAAAAILVSGIAIGSLAISAQGSNGVPATNEPPDAAAPQAIAAPASRAHKCPECGVIESTRRIEAPDERTGVNASGPIAAGSGGETGRMPVPTYETTIRLQDGSMRVIADAYPARWRLGERVKLIDGLE